MTDYYNGRVSIQSQPVVIANGATTSATLYTNGGGLIGIIMPAAFTGTTMTFNGSDDGSNFYPLYNSSGTALSMTVSTSRIILLSPGDLVGPEFLQLVSGSSEGGARTLIGIFRSFV